MHCEELMETDRTHELLALVLEETGKIADPDTRLDSLDLDSLDFLELVNSFEKRFKTKVPDADFIKLNRVSDFLAFLPD